MKHDDLKRLRKTATAIAGRHTFFMPLVYYNAAKLSYVQYLKSNQVFNQTRDWFVRNIEELQFEQDRSEVLTPEFMAFVDQWPEGQSLDTQGAMEEIHEPLAETLSNYFNLLTNCVAAVESGVNLKIAELLHSEKLTVDDINRWDSRGIGDRPLRLLTWLAGQDSLSEALLNALPIFADVVQSRNRFVHYSFKPAVFSHYKIELASIVGDENVSTPFCDAALAAIQVILTEIFSDHFNYGEAFEAGILGFRPCMSPSPYLIRPFENFDYGVT